MAKHSALCHTLSQLSHPTPCDKCDNREREKVKSEVCFARVL